MAAIEAQHLNVAYVAVAKSLGLPTQAYMALSDGKSLDAQAGGETFSSALLAAIAGVNSVSGPGMLDFVLTFSLPKLVFDNEVCGQCLHFVGVNAGVALLEFIALLDQRDVGRAKLLERFLHATLMAIHQTKVIAETGLSRR